MHQNTGRFLYRKLIRKERMEFWNGNSSAEIVTATSLMYG
jgi:hypothetical protein